MFGTAMIQALDKRLRGLTVQRDDFLGVNGVFIPKRSRIYEFQISIHEA